MDFDFLFFHSESLAVQGSIACRRWRELQATWAEIESVRQVRDRAIRLLRVHPLRVADAFQLAAALVACSEQTQAFEFLTADGRLREAAIAEGFRVA